MSGKTREFGLKPSDTELRQIFSTVRTIAMVGASDDPLKASHFVARYLSRRNFRVIGVNPRIAGTSLFGEVVQPDLSSVKADVDMVDAFRRSEAILPIAEEALALWPNLKVFWMQIGVRNAEAAELLRARGVTVIEDLCPKQEHQRLFGQLRMAGFTTGRVSSKLPS